MALAIFGLEAMDRVDPDFGIAVAAVYAHYLDVSLAARAEIAVVLEPLAQAFVVEDVAAVQLAERLDIQAYPALGLQDLHILRDHLKLVKFSGLARKKINECWLFVL